MSEPALIILFAGVFSGLLLSLLLPRKKRKPGQPSATPNLDFAPPFAKHYANFPQIRQALSASDTQYILRTAPPDAAKRAIRERRRVARHFLQGLREDFSNLARLGRLIAAFSPTVSREQETERLVLQLKFHLLYLLVWMRLATGNLPLVQLEHLTNLVERLAARMDEAMSEISAISAGQISSGLRV